MIDSVKVREAVMAVWDSMTALGIEKVVTLYKDSITGAVRPVWPEFQGGMSCLVSWVWPTSVLDPYLIGYIHVSREWSGRKHCLPTPSTSQSSDSVRPLPPKRIGGSRRRELPRMEPATLGRWVENARSDCRRQGQDLDEPCGYCDWQTVRKGLLGATRSGKLQVVIGESP